MTYRRLSISLLLIIAVALAACGDSDSDDATASNPIHDLPAESRLLANASGVAPFEGDADQFLAILPFAPLLPQEVAGDRTLQTATVIPSIPGVGKNDPEATLLLLYAGESDEGDVPDTIEITQHMRPMVDLSGLDPDTVDVGGAEAIALAFEDSDAIQLLWSDCGLTHTISSSVITREEAVAIGESMTDGCEDPTGG